MKSPVFWEELAQLKTTAPATAGTQEALILIAGILPPHWTSVLHLTYYLI